MKRSYLPWFLALLTICLLIPQTLSAGNKKSAPRAVAAAPPITVVLQSTPQLTAVDPYSNAVSSSDGLKPSRPFWYSVDQNGLTILRMGDNKVVYTIPWPQQLQLARPTGDGPDFMTINAPPAGWQPVGMVVTYPTEEQLASTSETPATYVFVVMAHSGYEWQTKPNPPVGQDPNVRDMIVPNTDPAKESSLLVEVDVTDPTYPVATYPTGPSVVAALLGHGAGQPAFDPATGNVYVGNMPSRSLPMSTAVSKDLTSFVSVLMPIAMAESAAAEPAVGVPDPPLVLCGPEHPDEGLLAGEPYVWPCMAEGGEGELEWEFQNLPPWVNVHLDKLSGEPDGILYGLPTENGTWTFQVRVTDLGEEPGVSVPNSSDWTSVTLNVTATGVAGEAEAGFETGVAGGQGVAGTGDCTPGPTSTPGSLVPNWIDVQPAIVNSAVAGCYVMGTAPVSGEYYEFTLPNFKFAYPFDREPVVFSGYVAGTYGFDPLPQGVSISGLAWHQIEKIHDPSTEADILNAEFIGVEPLTGQLYQILMPQGVIEGSETVVGPPEISVELDEIKPEGEPLANQLVQLRPDILDKLNPQSRTVVFGDLVVEADRDIFVSAPWIIDPVDGTTIPIGGGSDLQNGAMLKVNSTGVTNVDLPGMQASFLALNSDLRPAIPGSEPGQQDNGVLWVTGTNTGGVAVVDTALGLVGADQLLSVSGTSSLGGVAVDTGTAAAYVAAPSLSSVAIFNNAYLPRAPEIWLGIEATATFDIGTPGTFSVLATGTPYPKMSYSGTLPSGINFVDNGDGTATFSGTALEGSGGDYTITVMAANGISPDAAESFVLTVPLAPQVTSAATVTFTEGQAGTFTVTSIGAPGPVGLTITAALPEGVTFTDNEDGTAALAGTPAAGTAGTYIFDITAATSTGYPPNAIQSFTLIILPGSGGGTGTDTAPAFTSAAGTSVTVGQPISFQITATGSPAPAITQTGALPNGVVFYPYSGMAVLVGTPAAGTQGSYPLAITATNRAGSVTQNFVLTVNPSSETAPAITSANSADFKVGVAGSFTVIATGTPTPTLSMWGSLPGGVTFVDNGNGTAMLSGTPTTSGNFMFTITASNSVSNATQNFTLRVTPANPNLSVSPSSLSFAYTMKGALPSAQNISIGSSGSALSYTVSASGGTWLSASAGGTTPGSVSVSVNPSVLPAGTYNGTVTITSSGAANSPQTVGVSLTVSPAPTLNVSPSALSFAYTIGGSTPAAQSVAVSSSGAALSYTVSPSASWLTVGSGGNTPGNVSVSINPSGLGAQTYIGTITITSAAAGNSPQTVAVTLTVNPQPDPLQITTTSLPNGTAGQQYSYQLQAAGGVKPYTWALTNRRSLPNSFNLSSAGVLSGRPNQAGTYTFTVTVRDAASQTAGQSLTLVINVRPPRR